MTRNSSIELLRILCVLMIIVLHSIGINNSCAGVFGSVLGVIGNCSVTTFVLISGYYGIRRNFRKIFRLRNVASFYVLAAIVIELLMGRANSFGVIFSGVFPIISGKYWFLSAYVVLILLAPYINQLILRLNHYQFTTLIFVLVFVFYFIPTFFKHSIVPDGGKGVANMISVYFIGRYLAIMGLHKETKSLTLILTFIATVACIVGLNWIQQMLGLTDYFNARHLVSHFDADSSLFILVASICVLLLFHRRTFYNKLINRIAVSVFSVYVLEWYVRPFLFQYIDISNMKRFFQPMCTICFALGVFLVCLGIDQLRLLTTRWLERRFENFECFLFDKAKTFLKRRIPTLAENNT